MKRETKFKIAEWVGGIIFLPFLLVMAPFVYLLKITAETAEKRGM